MVVTLPIRHTRIVFHYILHKNNDQNMINYIPLKFPQTFTCELINLSIRGKNIYLIFKIEHC